MSLISKNNFVSYHGPLKVCGRYLMNQYNEIIVLKGISTHGIQWYGHYANRNMINALKNTFQINALRIAMYTQEGGYLSHPEEKEKVKEIVQICIDLDLYVIIDWHILRDSNPNQYQKEAIDFFDEMSREYKNCANVIYEICNEPNGNTSWGQDIKPYAEEVIPVIRKNHPNSVIIVGTEKYSTGIELAANDPLNFDNILYSFHFYAGTHKENYRNKLLFALQKKLPIIVSEFGVSDAETNRKLDLEEASIWLTLLKENHISIFNWALSDKNEASSLFLPGASTQDIDLSTLSIGGKFILEQYQNY